MKILKEKYYFYLRGVLFLPLFFVFIFTQNKIVYAAVSNSAVTVTDNAIAVTTDSAIIVTNNAITITTDSAVTVTDNAITVTTDSAITVPDNPAATDKILLSLEQENKNKVIVKWNKVKQAVKYVVCVKEKNKKEYLQKSISETQISIKLTLGEMYYLTVAAFDENEKKVTETKEYKIAIPQGISKVFTCSHGLKKVEITWKKSTQAEYYIIYRKQKTENDYKKIGKRKKCRYLDKDIETDKEYQYKIVPVMQTENTNFIGSAGRVAFSSKKIVATDHQKYSYTEMAKDIKELTKKYYGIVHSEIIGKSEDGRNIYDIAVGNPDAEKSLLVVSTVHAREYMASLLCMNQIEYYLQNYYGKIDGRKVNKVLDEICIHYIPMANPDGVSISQFGISSIKSASLRQKLYKMNRGSISLWKANARGVDLNDNFPYNFHRFASPGREGYSGESAASESESKAIISLMKKLKKQSKLKGAVNYHAMGSIIFGSCQSNSAVKTDTNKMYKLARSMTGYRSSSGYSPSTSLQGVSGSLRDYQMNILNVPSITIEIGRISCPGPISEFPSIWSKNKSLIFREADMLL